MKAFVVGFPKSGTMTLQTALTRSRIRSAHWHVPAGYVGQIIYENHFQRRPLLAGLEDFEAITQADVCIPHEGRNFWPQLDLAILHKVRREYPACTFLLNLRDPHGIARSIAGWGNLQERITRSDIPGLPAGFGASEAQLVDWIETHYAAVRSAFGGDERLVELDIAHPGAPAALGAALGVEIAWWGTANKGAKRA